MSENITSIVLIKSIKDIEEKELNHALKAQDITLSQAKTLSVLYGHPERQVTLKYLEKELELSQSVTAGIVKRLEQKKYVESFGDSADKRIKIVRITALGEQKYQASKKILAELENKVLSDLTDDEKRQFKDLLVKVRNTLQTQV